MKQLVVKRILENIKMQLEDIMNNYLYEACEDCPYKDTDCPGGMWCDK